MRFVYLDSRFTLRASFPRSVALAQLRFTLLAVTSSQRDLHPQVCAHAGRTKQLGTAVAVPSRERNRGPSRGLHEARECCSDFTIRPSAGSNTTLTRLPALSQPRIL